LKSGERPESLGVFGRLPGTEATRDSEAGVRKASREETAGGVWGSEEGEERVAGRIGLRHRDEGMMMPPTGEAEAGSAGEQPAEE
jgi:hypothetical protein